MTPAFQAFRLLRLSAELEGRAASLRREGLQCLTIALAGTDTKGLWEMLVSFFGTEQDKENVWDFIDPVSRVACPLDLESTDGDEDQGEVTASTATASTSKVGAVYTPTPHSVKISRQDVCALDQAIRVYPVDDKTLSATGLPAHLIAKRESRTSGSSGASLYVCVHPDCSLVFVAKGGPAPLHNHVRRHHLGMCLACPYCLDKFYYAGSGWRSHMEKVHPNVPWFKSQVKLPEGEQAAQLMAQLEKDPLALSQTAQCHDAAIQDTLPAQEEVHVVKQEIPDEELGGEYEEGEEDAGEEDDSDISLPEELKEAERPEPPPPGPGYAYAFPSSKAESLNPQGPAAIRYRSREHEEMDTQSKQQP